MSNHPTFKTEEELVAMKAADPAAFDLDGEAPPETEEAKAARERDENGRFKAKDAAGEEPGETPDAPAESIDAAPPAADDAPTDDDKPADDKPPVNMVPEPRLAEVVADRNRERDARLAAERRLAELEAAQAAANTTDYDAEIKALEQKYDDGDVEFVEFQKQMTTLVADKTRAEVLADVAKKDAERAQQTVQQQYDDARIRFFEVEENKALANTRTRDVAFRDAIQQVFEAGTAKTYDEVFAQAAEIVKRDFPAAAPAPTAPPADPHAARKAADAAAASRAAGTPPPVSGGVGGRGSPEGTIDLKHMKPGKFSSLPKDVQEKMLGEGAL
jgi:hypothetical protein